MPSCPSCFTPLSPDFAAWVCTSSKCEPQIDEVATRLGGHPPEQPVRNRTPIALSRPPQVKNWPPTYVSCPTCRDQTSTRICPRCHYGPLAPDWFGSSTTCIAMAGARTTGKSLYVAMAYRQLQQLGQLLDTSVDFADEQTRRVYEEQYEKELFKERRILRPTPPSNTDGAYQRVPLIFSLGMLGGQRRYLVFRDVAGEDLEAPISDVEPWQFMAQADCVLFMFDPLRVRAIREYLSGVVPAGQQTGGDPEVVLNNVLRVIGAGHPRLGIVLAKFDTMEELRGVENTEWSQIMANTGAAMLRDPSLTRPAYDDADGQLLDREVRSLLLSLDAAGLVGSVESPTNGNRLEHRYFAVSVLGESARGDSLTNRGILPSRCLDPLKWALSRNGVLAAVR